MPDIVKQALAFVAPKMSKQESLFLKGAYSLRKSFVFYRKIRCLNSKKNQVSFAMGVLVGNNPTVQQIARFIFGNLSLLKCTKDLHILKSLHRRCRRIIAGKHYVKVKGDRFDKRINWKKNLHKERTKAFFRTVSEIFKTLGQLTWHLSDVYSAYNDNSGSHVFVHGRALWNELAASDTTYLLKKLKKSRKLNDWIFQKEGMALSTKLLIGVLGVPSKVTPLKKEVKDKIKEIAADVEEGLQDIKNKWYKHQGIPKEYLSDTDSAPKKIEKRFITPPRCLTPFDVE